MCTCRKIDASSLMGLYTAAWDRHKKNKRDRGTAVVGISDDGIVRSQKWTPFFNKKYSDIKINEFCLAYFKSVNFCEILSESSPLLPYYPIKISNYSSDGILYLNGIYFLYLTTPVMVFCT